MVGTGYECQEEGVVQSAVCGSMFGGFLDQFLCLHHQDAAVYTMKKVSNFLFSNINCHK